MQRIVLAIAGTALLVVLVPKTTMAGSPSSGDIEAIHPLLPAGISDFNVELYGKLAHTWTEPDGSSVVEVRGDFSARMGHHTLASRDAVVWVRQGQWQDRSYLDLELFLWQDARIIQPAGTVESAPALLVTLRSFGRLVLNTDGHAPAADGDSSLYAEALRARGLLDLAPPPEPEEAETPVQVAPTLEQLRLARPKAPQMIEYSADQTIHLRHDGQAVVIAIGDVRVSQGSPAQSGEYLELRADAAVLYLKGDELDGAIPGFLGRQEAPADGGELDDLEEMPEEVTPQQTPVLGEEDSRRRSAGRWVMAAYLEG
ncbi:MAG: hypothetical protein V3S01_09450, partial [Dehalococcoidia bacterium]